MDDASVPGGHPEARLLTPTASDTAAAYGRITRFIRRCVEEAGAEGVVVGMDGGVDSTVTATLAVEALGSARVYGLILPCNKLGERSARDAESLATALGIEHDTLHVQPLFAQIGSVIDGRFDFHDDPILAERVIARLRTMLSRLAAEASDQLVCGTTNRSDRLLGELPGSGDRTADLSPIGHLYRTDVRAVAGLLELPEFVTDTPRRIGHIPGYVDGLELDADDERVDEILHLHVDEGLEHGTITEVVGVDAGTVSTVLTRYRRTERERRRPRRIDSRGETR